MFFLPQQALGSEDFKGDHSWCVTLLTTHYSREMFPSWTGDVPATDGDNRETRQCGAVNSAQQQRKGNKERDREL